jgi:hypothetical protein
MLATKALAFIPDIKDDQMEKKMELPMPEKMVLRSNPAFRRLQIITPPKKKKLVLVPKPIFHPPMARPVSAYDYWQQRSAPYREAPYMRYHYRKQGLPVPNYVNKNYTNPRRYTQMYQKSARYRRYRF